MPGTRHPRWEHVDVTELAAIPRGVYYPAGLLLDTLTADSPPPTPSPPGPLALFQFERRRRWMVNPTAPDAGGWFWDVLEDGLGGWVADDHATWLDWLCRPYNPPHGTLAWRNLMRECAGQPGCTLHWIAPWE